MRHLNDNAIYNLIEQLLYYPIISSDEGLVDLLRQKQVLLFKNPKEFKFPVKQVIRTKYGLRRVLMNHLNATLPHPARNVKLNKIIDRNDCGTCRFAITEKYKTKYSKVERKTHNPLTERCKRCIRRMNTLHHMAEEFERQKEEMIRQTLNDPAYENLIQLKTLINYITKKMKNYETN